jgi:hypothetical protein
MSIHGIRWNWAWSGILVATSSERGQLAALFFARKIPGVRFGPYRDEDFPIGICVLLCFAFTLLAYLMFC